MRTAIEDLLAVMARLRAPDGCPWDREQDHKSLRFHAVEEVYELMDAIEAEDDHEMLEELGDLLLQVVFHCQLAKERGAFDFEQVARHIVEKLIRRHPHVFGEAKVRDVEAVWAQWDKIKRSEKEGTRHARPSVLDGIPKHLPALLRAEKLVKKARKAKLLTEAESKGQRPKSEVRSPKSKGGSSGPGPSDLAAALFELVAYAQSRGWSGEALLRAEAQKRERAWRQQEKARISDFSDAGSRGEWSADILVGFDGRVKASADKNVGAPEKSETRTKRNQPPIRSRLARAGPAS